MQLSDFDTCANLVSLFLSRADEKGGAPFLWSRREGRWQSQSWTETARQVCLLAEGLRAQGLVDGDRVMLVSENRPEWCVADLAIMAAGCVTVPAYITNTERDHLHVLENSGARAVIVSSARLALPLLAAVLRSAEADFVVGMEKLPMHQAGAVAFPAWSDLLAGDAPAARRAVTTRVATIARGDLACIIYTSGTGGAPRGVMQHHGAILCNIGGAGRIVAEDFGWGDEVFLSFLPLSHAYEHTGGQFLPIGMGAQIYYAEGLDRLAGNIAEVQPSLMIVVPRLFEVLRTRIIKRIEKQGGAAQFLMARAVAIAERQARGRRLLRDRPMNLILEHTLRPRVRALFGQRLKALVSGGAPLNPEIGIFFQALGVTLLQGYGQTESGPVISCNRPSAGVKMDTVGPPLAGVEVKIAQDGEILVRGELVMHGYWRNPAETARVLVRDPHEPESAAPWLCTGDIGNIDGAGRIQITDRKKDMIVNDKGDNISPQKMEGMLTLQPEIAQALVVGDRRPYVVALIVPDGDWALGWAKAEGEKFHVRALQELPAFRAAIRAAIDRVNGEVSVIEKVRQFAFADEAFTIDNEEMTPSMKIRRHRLKERYGARLDGLYKA